MNLPEHIIKKSDRWYLNTKTNKWISVDYIEAWAKNYWKYHSTDLVKPSVSYKKSLKDAKRRWEL